MQLPTCTSTRIRSSHDAHKIFYAIQQGILQMVTRRLDADERLALRSGCIYAWEERGPHSEITGLGIERFTEGRRWSASRVRDEFLFYYEKYTPNQDTNYQPSSRPGRPSQPYFDPLVKQTYSVWVETENGRRKWHLTAYFTQATIDQLGTVDDIPDLQELVVPEGIFKSTKVSKNRQKNEEQGQNGAEQSRPSSITRTYAPFPSYAGSTENANTGDSQQQQQQAVMMYEPYQTCSSSVGSYSESLMSQLPSAPISPLSGRKLSHEPYYTQLDNCSPISNSKLYMNTASADKTSSFPSRPASIAPSRNSPQSYLRSPMRPPSLPNEHLATFTEDLNGMQYRQNRSFDSFVGPSHPNRQDFFPLDCDTRNTFDHTSSLNSRSYSLPAVDMADPTQSYPISYPQPDTMSSPIPNYPNPSPYFSYLSNQPRPEMNTTGHNQFHSSTAHRADEFQEAGFDLDQHHSDSGSGRSSESRQGSAGPSVRDLAPLNLLTRSHPYRREPLDDRTLRRLDPRST